MRDPLHWLSVQYKLTLMFGGICLLAFGVGGYLVLHSARGSLHEEILSRLDFQGRAHATALDANLRILARGAEDFASDGFIRGHLQAISAARVSDERKKLVAELERHLRTNKLPLIPAFQALTILDATGKIIIPGEIPPSLIQQVIPDVLQANGIWYSGILKNTETQSPCMLIASPLLKLQDKSIIGQLLVWVRPGIWISSALRSTTLSAKGESAQILLLDREGNGLDVPQSFSEPSGPRVDSEIARTGIGLRVLGKRSPGTEVKEVYSPLSGEHSKVFTLSANGWSVLVRLKSPDALRAITRLESRLLGVGILLAGLASLLLYFPIRFLARPLVLLKEAARKIKEGDFTTRVSVNSTDEIGELSEAFNAMALGLQQRTSRLEAVAQDLRVKQREVRDERDLLDAVIASMRDGLAVLDTEGKVVLSNTAAAPFLRLLDDKELVATPHHICHDQDRDQGEEDCGACMKDPRGFPKSCMIDLGKDVYEVHVAPLRPDEHGRRGRVLLAREVTERVAHEEKQIHQERLTALGEVAAVMAHELNNPLTAINMFNQIMADQLPHDSPLQENVEVIQRNTETCKQTIRELLDYATGASPEVGSIDIHATLEDVLRFLRPITDRSRIEVVTVFRAESPEVSGDEVQIRQVFVNLLMNAIQAANPDGAAKAHGGKITISTSCNEHLVMIEVSDDGIGIADKDKEQIFRAFYTSKPRGVGTGLGLSTARRIAEMHGGSLELVSSKPGLTIFRVRLRQGARSPDTSKTLVEHSEAIGNEAIGSEASK